MVFHFSHSSIVLKPDSHVPSGQPGSHEPVFLIEKIVSIAFRDEFSKSIILERVSFKVDTEKIGELAGIAAAGQRKIKKRRRDQRHVQKSYPGTTDASM